MTRTTTQVDDDDRPMIDVLRGSVDAVLIAARELVDEADEDPVAPFASVSAIANLRAALASVSWNRVLDYAGTRKRSLPTPAGMLVYALRERGGRDRVAYEVTEDGSTLQVRRVVDGEVRRVSDRWWIDHGMADHGPWRADDAVEAIMFASDPVAAGIEVVP